MGGCGQRRLYCKDQWTERVQGAREELKLTALTNRPPHLCRHGRDSVRAREDHLGRLRVGVNVYETGLAGTGNAGREGAGKDSVALSIERSRNGKASQHLHRRWDWIGFGEDGHRAGFATPCSKGIAAGDTGGKVKGQVRQTAGKRDTLKSTISDLRILHLRYVSGKRAPNGPMTAP